MTTRDSRHGMNLDMRFTFLAPWLAALPFVLPRADAADTPAPAGSGAKYEVHEWGTFTSLQSASGDPEPWNPFTQSDLPSFVFSRQMPTLNRDKRNRHAAEFLLLFGKTGGAWLQRMETPVLYFHADQAMEVDVSVEFPTGVLSEWFPQVSTFGPVSGVAAVLPDSNRQHLTWNGVRILGPGESRWQSATPEALPSDSTSSHYYAARETGANLVEVTKPFATEASPQRDRFLFYRGAGNFAAPLRVGRPRPDLLHLSNSSEAAMGPLFVVRRSAQGLAFTRVATLAGNRATTVDLPRVSAQPTIAGTPSATAPESADLARQMASDLIDAGLNQDEAHAMVKTWSDAWFEESGVRVLYLLPRSWVDQLLPLRLNPAPEKLVRAFVGRADSLDADTEARVRFTLSMALAQPGPVDARPVLAHGLGRFTPAVVNIAARQLQNARGSLTLNGSGPDALLTMAFAPTSDRQADQETRRRLGEIHGALEAALRHQRSDTVASVSP